MSFLLTVFCYFTIYDISQARIVEGKIGGDVSFSWTFNIDRYDVIHILHNTSSIFHFVPDNNPYIPRKPPDRMSVWVGYTTPENVTVTIQLLNVTEADAGMYRVVQQWDSVDLDDKVDLQMTVIKYYTIPTTIWKEDTEGNNRYTSMVTFLKENTEGTNHYTTPAVVQDVYTEGINQYSTAAMVPEMDEEDFPSKRHLLYIVLGMGAILAVVFITCLLHKIRICSHVDRVPNNNRFTDSKRDETILEGENLPGNYWTLVSNERGELSTAIETERRSGPILIEQTVTMATTNKESGGILRPDNIKKNEEVDGYLNPVHSCPVELDEYIHPVHSCPHGSMTTSIQFAQIL